MSKKIFIPTDFTVASLSSVAYAAEHLADGEELVVILFHAVRPPSGITDLLFSWQREWKNLLTDDKFYDECMMIRNKYASVIRVLDSQLFASAGLRSLQNYIEGAGPATVVYDSDYAYALSHDRSVDMLPLIKAMKCEKKDIAGMKPDHVQPSRQRERQEMNPAYN